jgi:phospholipase C
LTRIGRRADLRQTKPVSRVVGGLTYGWYDLTVTSSSDPAFVRTLAGHVEDGRPSCSDPALGR